jgi:hypothetical protein
VIATTNRVLSLRIKPTPIAGGLPRATDADVDVAPHAPYASTKRRPSEGLWIFRKRYADEVRRTRPYSVTAPEEDLCEYNSRTSSLQGFGAYCRKRHEYLR